MRMIFLNMLNKPWPKFHILSKIIKQHFEVWYKNEWSFLCKKDTLKAFLFLIYKKVEFVDLKDKARRKKYASSTPDPTFNNHFSLIVLWYKCTCYYQTLLHMGTHSSPPSSCAWYQLRYKKKILKWKNQILFHCLTSFSFEKRPRAVLNIWNNLYDFMRFYILMLIII